MNTHHLQPTRRREDSQVPFSSTKDLTAILVTLLKVAGFGYGISAAIQIWLLVGHNSGSNGIAQQVYQIVAFLLFATFFATAFHFLRWMHRAYRNLIAFAEYRVQSTPRWVVACWFIPFANVYMPFQTMCEIAAKSEYIPHDSRKDVSSNQESLPIGMWWSTYVMGGILGNVSLRMMLEGKTADILNLGHVLNMLGCFAMMASAYFACKVTQGISHRQEDYHLQSMAQDKHAESENLPQTG